MILDTLEEWKSREPEDIRCVVVGKDEIQDLINKIIKIKEESKK